MAVQISGNDITVPRDGSFTRNVTIGGTLTYEDVTNIDSVGLVTARTGIEIGARPGVAASISVDGNMIISGISTFGDDITFTGATSGRDVVFDTSLNQIRAQDNAKLCAGSSSDLEIYHNGSTSYIDNYTGALYLRNNVSSDVNGDIYIQAKSGENSVACYDDGAVELYHDSALRLSTTSTGVNFGGNLSTDSGTNLTINAGGASGTAGYFIARLGSENAIVATPNAAVELYYNNSKKLETNDTGSTLFCTGNGNNEGPKIEGSSSMPAILNFQADTGSANGDKCRFYGHQNGGSLLLQDFSAGSFQNMAKFNFGGTVELYNNNVKKFETTNAGATVTGTLTATAFESSTFSKTPTNTPAFHAWSGTSQSVALSDSTETKIQFLNSETLDTDSAYDNSTSGTTANRFTVPSGKGGYYQVSAGLNFYADSNDMRGIIMYVKKNGAVVITQYGFIGSYFAGMRHLQCNLSGILQLAAADYIELYAWLDTNGNSGGYISNDGNGYRGNFFSAHKLII